MTTKSIFLIHTISVEDYFSICVMNFLKIKFSSLEINDIKMWNGKKENSWKYIETNVYKWMVNKPNFRSKVSLGSALIRPKCVACKYCFSYPHGPFKSEACDEKWKIWQGKSIVFILKLARKSCIRRVTEEFITL